MPLLGKRFKLRQFAEQADESFFHGLPESLTKPLLLRFDFPNADAWKGTVVCHSPPDAWRPSGVPVAPSSASVMKSACMADRHEVRGQSHDPIFDDVALLDISHCTR